MDINEFEELVYSIINNVPEKFKDKVENLGIIIDDENILPSVAHSDNHKNKITLALYQGVPITKRFHGKPLYPDKITIYKKAIESVCKTDFEIRKTLKRVVLHELGHYFGLDESKLSELGY